MKMIAAGAWTTFVQRCLQERMPTTRFVDLARLLHKKQKVSGDYLAKALLQSQNSLIVGSDPLVIIYTKQLLHLNYLTSQDILAAVLGSFRARHGLPEDDLSIDKMEREVAVVSPELEQSLFGIAVTYIVERDGTRSKKEGFAITNSLVNWTKTVMHANSAMTSRGSSHLQSADTANVYTTVVMVGTFAVAVLESATMSTSLDSIFANEKTARSTTIPILGFLRLLSQLAPHISSRVDLFMQSQSSIKHIIDEYHKSEALKMTLADLQILVQDGPLVYSRASLVVHLDAILFGCPSAEDDALITYLQARYRGDVEHLILDIITATFDLSLLRTSRNDSEDNIFLIHSFLINKLPLLLLMATSLAIMPINMAFTVAQAMSRVDTHTPYRDTFLLSCVLHSLISEQNAEQILDMKFNRASIGMKVHKSALLQAYRNGTLQVEALVSKLEELDGNASTYAETLAEIIQTLCAEKNTMPLKSLCNALAVKGRNLDIMTMVVGIERFINPVCHVIDGWQHEDDHGEYQPVYDEFGACFMLVMICVKRFDLGADDLRTLSSRSFVAEMTGRANTPISHENLTPAQQGYLTDWIRGLFETEGISDELMSGCPPQDYYRIVGTLMQASFKARQHGVLTKEKLRSGLELLLEPFLLPSIMCVIPWLARHSWESPSDADIMLVVMTELFKSSAEPSSLRHIVLMAIGEDIEQILTTIEGQTTNITEVKSLQKALLPYLNYQRDSLRLSTLESFEPSLSGLESTANDFKIQFATLCTFSAGLSTTIPQYNHARLLRALRQFGAFRLLRHLVEAVVVQTQSGLGDLALDLAVALICAVQHGSTLGKRNHKTVTLSLQDALRSETEAAPRYSRTEPLRAQTLVRLSRRVEAELTHAPPLDMSMATTNMSVPIHIEAPAVERAIDLQMEDMPEMELEPTQTGQQEPSMSYDGAADSFNLDIEAALAAQDSSEQVFSAVPLSADDDIFADLMIDTEMDFS